MTKKEQEFVKNLCFGKTKAEDFPFGGLPLEKQAAIWELCSDYLGALLHSKKISPDEYRSRYLSVLSARRKLGKQTLPDLNIPAHPELAHGSKKISFAGGTIKKADLPE